MKMIAYGYSTDKACSCNNCSYKAANGSCSPDCKCEADDKYHNKYKKHNETNSDRDDEDYVVMCDNDD